MTITDSAGVVLATSVACSIKQHVNGMRDPIAGHSGIFNTLSVIALGWNGVGSLRVVWRAFLFIGFMPCNFTTVVPDLVFCSPAGSPFWIPYRFFCFRGCAAATVHCDSLADWHG